jgi:6-phosphofructokinase
VPGPIKRIAINSGGGDAPGRNAVLHTAVDAARLTYVPTGGNAVGTARAMNIALGD